MNDKGGLKPLLIMISGGRTSAYMAHLCKQHLSDTRELIYIFVNTAQEDADTYRYLSDVDKNFNLNVVWLEAVIHDKLGQGITHKVVTYETASRNGEPFEAMIEKHGIPNNATPFCTSKLKLAPVDSYLREQGLTGIERAIGIREDENRRVSKSATKDHIIYPLIDMWPCDKQDVLDFWSEYEWDLQIPEWRGNCVTCLKKSFGKLLKVYQETPEAFDFNLEMEEKYGRSGPRFDPARSSHGLDVDTLPNNVFHRGAKPTKALIEEFQLIIATDAPLRPEDEIDTGTCAESCEMYETEQLDFFGEAK